MPNWHDILQELKKTGSADDVIRRKYLGQLHEISGRNTIVYYSGWLQKQGIGLPPISMSINDSDKNGFMTVINNLDRTKGLDLLIHTPGGEIAATESLVDYLHSMFGYDIRAIVPQLALSGGTMIACGCKEIIMGAHSSLGPIDPQYRGLAAHAVIEEFQRAHNEIKADQSKVMVWQPIIAKYAPTFIGECEKAVDWANSMAKEWLKEGMLNGIDNVDDEVDKIILELGDHALTKSHSRHLSLEKCQEMGLKVTALENDQAFQEAVLSIHHACIHTLSRTPACKIIENQNGIAFIEMAQQVVMPQ